ncbi:MAG: zinc ribbon domain-containing protein [Clostridiales bacterium]|nr:zinc ribbon domain-containing protein [Clostridiales bacterium]
MAFMDQVRKTWMGTKNMGDNAALSGEIGERERQIEQLYAQLGRQYYETHGEEPEPELAPVVQQIDGALEELRDRKRLLQEKLGLTNCPQCGREVPMVNPYCSYCGCRLPQRKQTVCRVCGASLVEGALFCIACGERVPQQTQPPEPTQAQPQESCPRCGTVRKEGVRFCPTCGFDYESAARETDGEA